MTLTLDLPPETERALEAKARLRGVPVATLLRDVVSDFAAHSDEAFEEISTRYVRSLETNDDLTAATRFQEEIHEYSAAELAAMEAGEFERPLR